MCQACAPAFLIRTGRGSGGQSGGRPSLHGIRHRLPHQAAGAVQGPPVARVELTDRKVAVALDSERRPSPQREPITSALHLPIPPPGRFPSEPTRQARERRVPPRPGPLASLYSPYAYIPHANSSKPPETPVPPTREPASPESFLPLTSVEFEILLALADAPLHGYGILKAVEGRSGGGTTLHPGTLYRALDRLSGSGLLEEAPDADEAEEADDRRRYYRLTSLGRRVARAEALRLESQVGAARARNLLEGTGPP